MSYEEMYARAKAVLDEKRPWIPDLVIVLGSGLGALADCDEARQGVRISFEELGLPGVKVVGHGGFLVFCELEGKKVLLQSGRYHFYEGHSMEMVTIFMRLYGAMGVKTVVMSNASGAVNEGYEPGDLMLLTDHINLMGTNPLIGPNVGSGRRFPDMTEVYSKALRTQILVAAKELGHALKQGIYLAVTGPSYETPAEIRMMRILGADAVGMSTVPEAIVARHEGMLVVAISCAANMAAGILDEELDHDDVTRMVGEAMPRFVALIRLFVRNLELPA